MENNCQIVLLNGPSSAGKSSIARMLKTKISEKTECKIIALDDYLTMTTDKPIYGDDILELTPKMCSDITEALKENFFVVIDHVITDSWIYESVMNSFENRPYRKVLISCALEILREREKARGDRFIGSAEESLKYLYPKDDYDIVLDSSKLTTEQIVEEICKLF